MAVKLALEKLRLLAEVSHKHVETIEEKITEMYVTARSVNQVQSGLYHALSNH